MVFNTTLLIDDIDNEASGSWAVHEMVVVAVPTVTRSVSFRFKGRRSWLDNTVLTTPDPDNPIGCNRYRW